GVGHLDDRPTGIDDAEVDHRVHLDRHVVARDHVLLRHAEHDDPQVHLAHPLDDGPEQDDSGAPYAGEAPEREHHGALVLVQHPDGTEHQESDDDDDDDGSIGHEHLRAKPAVQRNGSTHNVRPSTFTTRAACPAFRGTALQAFHSSPPYRTRPPRVPIS